MIVSESFDSTTASKLIAAVRSASGVQHAGATPLPELAPRLYSLPAFRAYQSQIGDEILRRMISTQVPTDSK